MNPTRRGFRVVDDDGMVILAIDAMCVCRYFIRPEHNFYEYESDKTNKGMILGSFRGVVKFTPLSYSLLRSIIWVVFVAYVGLKTLL
jgi:hypothetical protein